MTYYQIMLQQLGGNRFVAMTGANTMTHYDKDQSLTFKIMKNAKKVTHVKISLNANDLYNVQFLNIRGMNMKTVYETTDVYAENLRELFETQTGLYTSL